MENKLNIQITVNDEQLSSLIKGNLKNLPDEKIQEIFGNALSEFLSSRQGQELFYTKDYYGGSLKPTKLLIDMVSNAASKDLLKPYIDEFIESIKENYENLIKEAMIKTFSNLFLTELNKATFEEQLHYIIDSRLNNNQYINT